MLVDIKTESDLLALKQLRPKKKIGQQHYTFVCCDCNMVQHLRLKSITSFPIRCRGCRVKRRYDDPEYFQRIKATNLARYGVEYNSQTTEWKESIKRTSMEKYGVEHFTQAKEIKERIVSSNINKYGGIGFSSPELMEKQHKTMMEKYNSYHNMLVPELKEKCFDSIRRKHGGLGNASTELKEKQHQTMLERYGDIYPEQIHEINLLFKRKYKYNGIFFDSLSEIAYYKKLSETGAKFTYHPKIRYDYTYNGKRHYYFPDFEVDGKVIEIKGTHFFTSNDLSDPNTQMINPYNRKYDGLANAKFNCMKEHDVEIILVEPMKESSKYIRENHIEVHRSHKQCKDTSIETVEKLVTADT